MFGASLVLVGMDVPVKFVDSSSNRSRDMTASLCYERRGRRRQRQPRKPTDPMTIGRKGLLAAFRLKLKYRASNNELSSGVSITYYYIGQSATTNATHH